MVMPLGRVGWGAIGWATAVATWAVVDASSFTDGAVASALVGSAVLWFVHLGLRSAPYSQPMLGLRDQVDVDLPPDVSSTPRIDAHPEVVADFLRRVMKLDAAECSLSDGTTLWNLHREEDNREFVQRTYFAYGVDISDIQPPYLCQIAERIARRGGQVYHPRMAGSDPMPPSARSGSDQRLTYDDLLLFPDDRTRRELIDGELYVTPSPTLRHQDLLGRLHVAIANHLTTHPAAGRVFLSPLDVVFSSYDVVEPDLLVIAGDQLEILTPNNVQGSPALVVEILSPGTRKTDEQTKRRLFSRTAVREYWIIDPDSDLIKVWRRVPDGSFMRVAELATDDGDTLMSPLLPGFSLQLSEFFAPTT